MQKLKLKNRITPVINRIKKNFLFVDEYYSKFNYNTFIHIIPAFFMDKYNFIKLNAIIEFKIKSTEFMGYINKTKVLCRAKIVEINKKQFDTINYSLLRYNCASEEKMLKSAKEFLILNDFKESNPNLVILKLQKIETNGDNS